MQSIGFCEELLSFFDTRSQLLTSLVIALAGRQQATSVVSLSLESTFYHQFSSVTDAIRYVHRQKMLEVEADSSKPEAAKVLEQRFRLERLFRRHIVDYFPPKVKGRYYILATDVTPIARPHSPCLPNREYVYRPNKVIKTNKPITLGYRLSCVGLSARHHTGQAWMLPLSMQKIAADQTENECTIQQLNELLEDEQLPFKRTLTINCLDSKYANCIYINGVTGHEQLVNIIRFAANRVAFRQIEVPPKGQGKVGHPFWYGDRFSLKEPESWHECDEQTEVEQVTKKGRKLLIRLQRWNDMLVTGKRKFDMYDKPFDLVRVQVLDAETKQPIYNKDMWLTAWGKEKKQLSLSEIYEAYRTRFDIEHFFRFGKQRLLLDSYQTTKECYTENWFQLVLISYWLLYVARQEAIPEIPKWQTYNTQKQQASQQEVPTKKKVSEQDQTKTKTDLTPSQTQRGFFAIIREFANQYLIPKARNNSSGRKKGTVIGRKKRYKVLKKSKNKQKKTAKKPENKKTG